VLGEGRRLFRGVRPWVRTWYEACGESGVSGLTPRSCGAGEDPGDCVMEGRALSVLLEVEGCGHPGESPWRCLERGWTRDEILTRAVEGVKGRYRAFGNGPGLGSGYSLGGCLGLGLLRGLVWSRGSWTDAHDQRAECGPRFGDDSGSGPCVDAPTGEEKPQTQG
jgi:hypothetical protein